MKQAEDKVNSVPVEEQMNNPVEMVPTVQEEKTKNEKGNKPSIPPGKIKKEEKQTKRDEKRTKKEEDKSRKMRNKGTRLMHRWM